MPNSIPTLTILWIVFVILKLAGYINWSWWWIFSPIWIPLFLLCFLFTVIIILLGLGVYLGNRDDDFKK